MSQPSPSSSAYDRAFTPDIFLDPGFPWPGDPGSLPLASRSQSGGWPPVTPLGSIVAWGGMVTLIHGILAYGLGRVGGEAWVGGLTLGGAVALGWGWRGIQTGIQRWAGPLDMRLLELLALGMLGWGPGWLGQQLDRTVDWIPWVDRLTLAQPLQGLGYGWLGLAAVAVVGLPWLGDGLLAWGGGLQWLSSQELQSRYPQTHQLLRRYFVQGHRLPLPQFGLLGTEVPWIWVYGPLPRWTRVVVSVGLSETLTDGELATIVARELSLLDSRSQWILPALVLGLQLPYGLYGRLSQWGDRLDDRLHPPRPQGSRPQPRPRPLPPWQRFFYQGAWQGCRLGSGVAYGVFKLWRWPLLAVARQRSRLGDRGALDLLPQPHTYSRALLKFSLAVAGTLQRHGSTPPLLESWELVQPVGYYGVQGVAAAARVAADGSLGDRPESSKGQDSPPLVAFQQIPSKQIALGQIPPEPIPPGQIPSEQIPPGQIALGQIKPGQIPLEPIPSEQIPPDQISLGQIKPGQIKPGQIPSASEQIEPGQIPSGQIPSEPMPSALISSESGGHDRPLDLWLAGLAWECSNPQRHWLSLNQAHPPTGDRLRRIPTSLPLPPLGNPLALPLGSWFRQLRSPARQRFLPRLQQELYQRWLLWQPLLIQGFPFTGLLLGLGVGLGLWFVGAWLTLVGFWQFAWLLGEKSVLQGAIPLGISLGLVLRNNSFFPDFARRILTQGEDFGTLLQDLQRLPHQPLPIRWQSQIQGRSGLGNALGQDLWIDTPIGWVKLHLTTAIGPLGLLARPGIPSHWVGKTVVVQGWLRRGATLWIDVDAIRGEGGQFVRFNHPGWLLVLAAIALTQALQIL